MSTDIDILLRGKDQASAPINQVNSALSKLSARTASTAASFNGLSRQTATAANQMSTQMAGAASGMRDALGGLGFSLPTLGIAGIAAAGVGALRAADQLGKLGAQSLVTADSFDSVLASVGRGPEVLDALKTAASGTVSDLRLMQLTNTALAGASKELGGAFTDAIPKLLQAARAANMLNPALGDTEFLFQSLVTGIKRGSPMLIDNTGITLKLGEANETYAKKLGKSSDALTEEEKKVALLTATMEGADRLIQQVGGNLDNLTTSAQQSATAWQNLKSAIGEKLAPDVSAAQSGLANFLNNLTNIVSGKQPEIELRYRVTTDLEQANMQLREAEAGLAKAAQQGTYLSGTTDAWQREVDEARVAVVEADIAMQRLDGTLGQTGFDGWSDAGVQAALRVRDAALEASAALMGPFKPEPVVIPEAKPASPYAFTGPNPKLVGQKIWNDALAAEKTAKELADAQTTALNKANTGIANDYRSKMSSAIDRASSYMQSEFSAAQQASIGLADQRPGGAGGVNAPGQNGAFEDIFRLQAWLNDGSWQETADKFGIANKAQAQGLIANFQVGNITPDVAKLIDTEALVAQARLKTAAEANYAAFAQAIADKAGTDKTTAQTVLDGAFGLGTAKTGDQTAAQKTGASAAQALASAFQVEIKGKDFAGQMIGYGETVWGYAEKGIIDKAKTSKAFGVAIKLMVENVLASELES